MYESDAYFSESQRQLIPVGTMPLPYARNVLQKLIRDDVEKFWGTPLHDALVQRLCPDRKELIRLLAQHGTASYYLVGGSAQVDSARRRFYRIGKSLGVKVHTHWNSRGDFMEGSCEPVDLPVHIRRVGR